MKTICTKISYCTKRLAFIFRHHSLSGIFYYKQVIFFCCFHDFIHFTANTCIMYWNNSFCSFSYGIFNQIFINIHCIRSYIYKYRNTTPYNKSVCCRNKGVGWHYYLISGLNISEKSGHFKSMSA